MKALHKPTACQRISFLGACVVSVYIGVAGVGLYAAENTAKPFVIAVSNPPKTLDPMLGADAAAARVLQLTHPALLQFNAGQQPVGLVAAGCTQPDMKTVECTLPSGRTYTDGTPVTAARVATWLGKVQSNPKSPLASMLAGVSLTTPTSQTVRFALPSPTLTFSANLVQIPLAKPENPAIGAGPYVLEGPDTLGAVTVRTNVKNLAPALTFLPVTDATTRMLKLKKGEVDAVYNDISADMANWAKANGFAVVAEPGTSYTYMGFNFANPVLANASVREALTLALNRPAIRRALLGGLAAPAETLLPPGHPAAWAAPEEPFDPFTAEGLLDDAGYLRGPDNTRFTLTLLTSTDPQYQRISQALQAELEAIGVRVVLRPSEWASFFDQVQKGSFDAVLLAWTGELQPDIYYQIFNSTMVPPKGLNRGRLKDATVDTLTESLHTAPTTDRLTAQTVELQKVLAGLRPTIPLYRRFNILVTRPGVTGCKLVPAGYYTGFAGCKKP